METITPPDLIASSPIADATEETREGIANILSPGDLSATMDVLARHGLVSDFTEFVFETV